eukprot:UC1_evm1s201
MSQTELQNKVGTFEWRTLSPALSISPGRGRPASDYAMMLEGSNRAQLELDIVATVKSIEGLYNVRGLVVKLNTVDVADDSGVIIRRDVEGFEISFDYEYMYKEDSSSEGPYRRDFDPNNLRARTILEQRLRILINTFDLQPPHKCYSLTQGWIDSCLTDLVKDAYRTCMLRAGSTRPACVNEATAALNAQTRCGVSGKDTEGKCLDGTSNALPLLCKPTGNGDGCDYVSFDPASLVASSANQVDADLAASSAEPASDGGSIIPIAAGAGAGALLIIIIVIVVVRKKKSAAGGGLGRVNKESQRSVVAFENPMYDDPTSGGAAAASAMPDYDAPGGDEGLYDEPAFNNAQEKSNPMYQSNEDLAGLAAGGVAASSEEEEGGYLDVEEGYLDVSPEDEAAAVALEDE